MIKPLGNNLILEKIKEEHKSGLIITTNEKEKLVVYNPGTAKEFKKGQEVITNGRGSIIEHEGKKLMVVNKDDIIAVKE